MSAKRRRSKKRRAKAPAKHVSNGVACLLCGEIYRSINHMHLRAAHGWRGRHPIEDYKRRFGLRFACSDQTRERLSESVADSVRRDPNKQRWTRRKLLAELRQRARSGEVLRHGLASGPLQSAARRLYSSWNTALEAAGLDPDAHRLRWRWDRPRIIEAIREACAGGEPDALVNINFKDQALRAAAVRHFGSWPAAVEAAGCDDYLVAASRRIWHLEAAEQWVRDTHRAGRAVIASCAPRGLYDRVREDTGNGWGAFVESLGIAYPHPVKWTTWTAETVLCALRYRARRGRPLGARAVQDEGRGLYYHACKHYGSWGKARARAGVS